MALTRGRWTAACLIAALIAGTALLGGDQSSREINWGERTERGKKTRELENRLSHLTFRVVATAERVRTLELRDSIRVVQGNRPLSRNVTTIISPELAVGEVVVLDIANRMRATPLANDSVPGIPTVLAFVLDSARTVRGVERARWRTLSVDHLLPTGTEPTTCMVLIRTRRVLWPGVMTSRYTRSLRSGTTGPCRFFQTFGMPGPAIRQWFLLRGAELARSADWERGTHPLRQDNSPAGRRVRLGNPPDLRTLLSADAMQCLGGSDETACLRVFLEPSGGRATWGENIVATNDNDLTTTVERPPLGLLEETLLADMALRLGPAKFSAFWTSPHDPATAFRTATGTDLGDWVSGWANRTYWKEPVGPGVSSTSMLGGTIATFVFLAIAGGVATRRRMLV